MVAIFFSVACDYCDGLRDPDARFEGWIVWSNNFNTPHRSYVFKSQEHACRWKTLRFKGDASEVRKVVSIHPFNWRSGLHLTSDMEFADTLIEIHADHKYEARAGRAHLAEK